MTKQKNKKRMPLHHITGWYGSIAIVSGYFLVSLGTLATDSLSYQLINLTGASGLLYLGYKKGIKESMFLNGFWVVIAVISIARIVA